MIINHLPDISTEVEGLHSKRKVCYQFEVQERIERVMYTKSHKKHAKLHVHVQIVTSEKYHCNSMSII
jgi:hypothetical protein